MSEDLVSSVPGVFAAFFALVKAAGEEQPTPIPAFAFELGQYEPAGYVLFSEIANHDFEWESLGSFAQKESYSIKGEISVFDGDSPNTNPAVVSTVMATTYSMFQACVMTPAMSNRDMPILGTTGPTPYLMLPAGAQYTSGPAAVSANQAGFYGKIEWSFHFEAILTPQ